MLSLTPNDLILHKMHDYQENFSSQMKITVEDGLIIPITAVLSKSDDQNDDPLLNVPCYTENP